MQESKKQSKYPYQVRDPSEFVLVRWSLSSREGQDKVGLHPCSLLLRSHADPRQEYRASKDYKGQRKQFVRLCECLLHPYFCLISFHCAQLEIGPPSAVTTIWKDFSTDKNKHAAIPRKLLNEGEVVTAKTLRSGECALLFGFPERGVHEPPRTRRDNNEEPLHCICKALRYL